MRVPHSSHLALRVLIAAAILITGLPMTSRAASKTDRRVFTTSFRLADCTFQTDSGANPFFILQPGHVLHLQGTESKESVDLTITVTNDTENISLPGLGTVATRVVEEREKHDGEIAEVSRNFYAVCQETSDVYYFGEEVDIYEAGVIVSHGGAWRAGTNGAMPGLFMPGTFLLGSRYAQEVAPGVAMDRAENIAMNQTITVPAGPFQGCATTLETSALERNSKETKSYAPGVGVIVDDTLQLVDWTPAP
jgi:hypothetical protein